MCKQGMQSPNHEHGMIGLATMALFAIIAHLADVLGMNPP
jgi:hypothetical protein